MTEEVNKLEKSDIRELRKVIKAKETVIDWIYGLYVDSENHAVWEKVQRLCDMDEAEQFRHINLIIRVLSMKVGCDSFPAILGEHADAVLAMRKFPGESADEFEEFRERLLNEYVHTDPYYAMLARIIYDVPSKAADGRHLEDGENVYEAVLFAICPAKLSRPALGFEEDEVVELTRRWQIGNPVSGFLYPAFSERNEDRGELLIHSKHPDTEDFLRSFFNIVPETAPVGVTEQKTIFSSLLGQIEVDLEEAAAVCESLACKASEENAPQLLEAGTMSRITREAGIDIAEEELKEIYEETVGEVPIAMTAITDPYVIVRTDSALVKVPVGKAQLIESRRIDGRDYILIPADGAVMVNGLAVTARDIPETGSSDG